MKLSTDSPADNDYQRCIDALAEAVRVLRASLSDGYRAQAVDYAAAHIKQRSEANAIADTRATLRCLGIPATMEAARARAADLNKRQLALVESVRMTLAAYQQLKEWP